MGKTFSGSSRKQSHCEQNVPGLKTWFRWLTARFCFGANLVHGSVKSLPQAVLSLIQLSAGDANSHETIDKKQSENAP